MKLTLDNYHSLQANKEYMSVSQYKNFAGSAGILGCEAAALARINGTWEVKSTDAMLLSSYVDSYFSGTLDKFKTDNPKMFCIKGDNKGKLQSQFRKAHDIIKRIESSEYFMKYLSGEKQVIMTGKAFGCEWKIAIDSLIINVASIDLKVMKSITKTFWVKDYGYCSFVIYYGYDIQAAVYQTIVEVNTGKQLPFFIAGASKEPVVDIEIIGIDNKTLSDCRIEIAANMKRILKVKSGEAEADRCGQCEYCRSTKMSDISR